MTAPLFPPNPLANPVFTMVDYLAYKCLTLTLFLIKTQVVIATRFSSAIKSNFSN